MSLQDIASQVPTPSQKPFYWSNITNFRERSTRYGPCPRKGDFTSDGQLFIGKYPKESWNSNEVKKYHGQILYAMKNLQRENRHAGFKNNQYNANRRNFIIGGMFQR